MDQGAMSMEKFLEWVECIEEPRQQIKVRHKLKDIIVIVLFATLANANDWVEISLFARLHEDFLKKYITLDNGIPSHDTIQRVMAMLSPETFQQIQGNWQTLLNTEINEKLAKIIAIDGKTMRGNTQNGSKASHIISAWCEENGFCLGQIAVEEKSNEITAIPKLLDRIQIKGQIVTIDAMGTQTAIAEKIREKRADYVLAVKSNQRTLYEDLRDYFNDKEFLDIIEKCGMYRKTIEKAHSQIELREYYQTEEIAWLPQRTKWKGLKSIGMERKTITHKDGTKSVEYRYYICSIEGNVNLFSRAVREHWSVESMHWHLDVTFREDANHTIDKISAQNLNIIRKCSLSILKAVDFMGTKMSLKKKRFAISQDAGRFLEMILCR